MHTVKIGTVSNQLSKLPLKKLWKKEQNKSKANGSKEIIKSWVNEIEIGKLLNEIKIWFFEKNW